LAVGASTADIPDPVNGGQTLINAGTVTVFDRNVDGTWLGTGQTLTAMSPGASDLFGLRVTIANDGNLIVVGAFNADILDPINPQQTIVDAGHVTIFTRPTNGSWLDSVKTITAVNPEKSDHFSVEIVLSSDSRTLVVGARNANVPDPDNPSQPFYDAGNVTVFTLSSNGSWIDNPVTLTAVNPGQIHWFGWDFALSNDAQTLVVGAPRGNSPDPNNPGQSVRHGGAVTVFKLSPNGLWTDNVKTLSSADPKLDDYFGRRLVLSADGKTLAVAAPFATSQPQNTIGNTLVRGGTTTVFELSSSGSWTEKITTFTAQNLVGADAFGGSLSLTPDGKTLAVGASFADIPDPNNPELKLIDVGSVTVFSLSSTGSWFGSVKTITAPNPGSGDGFGYPVILSADGRSLVVGAGNEDNPNIDINGNKQTDCYNSDGTQNASPANCSLDSGAVYIY